ncbi:MAG: hypothetical protein P9E88_11415, partial [Candidatus Competibacter sp.]|nr:hypothetical protein [Candidatus Competibacter sp.]
MNTTIEIESTPFDQPELTNTPASDQPDHIHLDLWLWDADLVQPLSGLPTKRERDEFIRRALRIGILALQQAQARIDADCVRREGEHLITQLGNRLSTFQNQIDNVLTTTLKDYLDPRDGRFVERVERLIRNGGDLEKVMHSRRSPGYGPNSPISSTPTRRTVRISSSRCSP